MAILVHGSPIFKAGLWLVHTELIHVQTIGYTIAVLVYHEHECDRDVRDSITILIDG